MYKYLNPNPKRRLVIDCVIRAIAIAENRSWLSVYDDLALKGREMYDMPSSNEVWGEYLKDLGYSRYLCDKSRSIEEFAFNHEVGIFIVGTGTHVVTIIDGDWYDTWDSKDEVPIYFFV